VLRGGGTIQRMKVQLVHTYEDIISPKNLLKAWKEFLPGKRNKEDVRQFSLNLMENIFDLHKELVNKTYKHGGYKAFNISDPKPRNIHKAIVRDRLLHHAVYRVLYPFFNGVFSHCSYSCRVNKGTHRAVNRFRIFASKESKNNMRTIWVLKCDIKKFFASIDQSILIAILKVHIPDSNIIWLLERIIGSFLTSKEGVGLPLGNLTSQLLVNIYMNEFDQWVKHRMKVRHYIRYADDFVILNKDKYILLELIPKIADFLDENLKLQLHPNKLYIATFASGVDFLGWVNFSGHRVLRTSTKRRVMVALSESENISTLRSYLGLLKHGNHYELRKRFEEKIEMIRQREVNTK
jgi:RNA-directed DNA polymerase